MNWMPEAANDIPIYKQICTYFENEIRSGSLQTGARLPTERELASRLCVNRSTVTVAYDELRALGLIESRQGSGTRVCGLLWETKPVKQPRWQRHARKPMFDAVAPIRSRIHQSLGRKDVIQMVRGELSPDLMPLDLLQNASQKVNCESPFSYFEDFRGDIRLRSTLSRFLNAHINVKADPDQLMITSGVKHSLSLIARTLLQPGDAIAVEGPSYLYAMQVFAEEGLRMVKLEMDEEGLIPEQLPRLYQQYGVRMVFTNPTYQNPTGTTMPLHRRVKLLEICELLRIPIVEDDPYSLLYFGELPPQVPAIYSLDLSGRYVIYLGTLSKFATAGMRTGFVAGPENIIQRLADARNRTGYSSSHMGERLADAFLNEPGLDQHLELLRKGLGHRREVMLQALQRETTEILERFAPSSAPGGYYIWLRLKNDRMTMPDLNWIEMAMRHGILFYPGSVYGEGGGRLRLTYASVSLEEIEEGIRRLGCLLSEMSVI